MPPRHFNTTLGALAIVTMLMVMPKAYAEEGEFSLAIGTGLVITTLDEGHTSRDRFGPLIDLSVMWSLDDFWMLGARLQGALQLEDIDTMGGQGHLTVETRYVIDALVWVPWAAVGFGVLVEAPASAQTGVNEGLAYDLTLHLGAGIDYRPERDYALGMSVRYHFAPLSMPEKMGPIEVGIQGSFFFD